MKQTGTKEWYMHAGMEPNLNLKDSYNFRTHASPAQQVTIEMSPWQPTDPH